MRRRRFPLRALARICALALLPCSALVVSCGFTADIRVDLDEYDRTDFLTFSRCGADNNQVELLYHLFTQEETLMNEQSPLLLGRRGAGVKVEFPEAFAVEGQTQTIAPTVVDGSNKFVQLSVPKRARAFAMLMDNSRSLDGFNEVTNTPENPRVLTDPGDQRISGANVFVNDPDTFLQTFDQATVIAFHGDGKGGVFPKLRARDGEPPAQTWFTSNRPTLVRALSELKDEEIGKTPLYDAVSLGVDALGVWSPSVQKIIVTFLDGPDNSSEDMMGTEAKAKLVDKRIPLLGIGLAPKLAGGEQQLRELACATDPQGAVMIAPTADDLVRRFRQMGNLVTGYWSVSVRFPQPAGLPAGTYNVTGRMFADPEISPKQCDPMQSPTCPGGMECDAGSNRCFVRVSFTYSTN